MTQTLQVDHEPREVLLTDEVLCRGDGYPWPCPGELRRIVNVVMVLHPAHGYCTECGQIAPCNTRRATDGEVPS